MAHDRKPSPCRASGVGVPVRSLHAGGSDAASAPKRHTYGPQRASELVTGSSPRGLGRGADLPVVRSGSGHVAALAPLNLRATANLNEDAGSGHSGAISLRIPESDEPESYQTANGPVRGLRVACVLMLFAGVLAVPVWGHAALALIAAWFGGGS